MSCFYGLHRSPSDILSGSSSTRAALPSWWRNFSCCLVPWCSFVPFCCALSLPTREKRLAPLFPPPLLRKLWRASRMPLSLPSSRLDNKSVLSLSSWDMPFTSFVALLWTLSGTLTSFWYIEAPKSTQYSRWGHSNIKYSGRITSFNQLC